MASARYPVIAPALRLRERPQGPSDLLRIPLIYDETDDAWLQWFALAGLPEVDLPFGPTYPNCELATTMVEQGEGVSLAYDAVARGTIASGRLERLFDIVTPPVAIYAVACQEGRAGEDRISSFRSWLQAEAAAEGVLPDGSPAVAE